MRIAIIGSGIAGLSAGWLLAPHHQVTVYESAGYAGGHSNTVDVCLDGLLWPVDTGFLVHNDRTYPNLIQLFRLLGVTTYDSDMSFSVRHDGAGLEWSGTSLNTLFAQRRNLLRPAFLSMVADILRFNRNAQQHLSEARSSGITLGELLDRHRYSRSFREWYLLPMGAAIWSSPLEGIEAFPAETFIQFCINHGLLQIADRPQWRTVVGGSREYVTAIRRRVTDVRLNTEVTSVHRSADGVAVTTASGTDIYERVILATHSDQSARLLKDASEGERSVLGSVAYLPNVAFLHTDASLMPRRRKAWSAWNYLAAASTRGDQPVAVTYWLNQLQDLPFKTPVFVTLNPESPPAPEHVIQRFDYAHPQLDQGAYAAQKRLADIQGTRGVFFAGAWTGYGFHEDGLKAGMRVARLLGVEPPWEAVW